MYIYICVCIVIKGKVYLKAYKPGGQIKRIKKPY